MSAPAGSGKVAIFVCSQKGGAGKTTFARAVLLNVNYFLTSATITF